MGGALSLIMSQVQSMTKYSFQGRVQSVITAVITLEFLLFLTFLYLSQEVYSAQHAFMLLAGNCFLVMIGVMLVSYIKKKDIESV